MKRYLRDIWLYFAFLQKETILEKKKKGGGGEERKKKGEVGWWDKINRV